MFDLKETLTEPQVEEFYAYGFAQYEGGNWGEAADAFRLLCTRRPFEPKFWFALGASLQEAGSFLDALYAWAMASMLKVEDPYPHFHAAECYFSIQDTPEAAKALKQAEERISKSHPLIEKVQLLKEQWKL